MRIGLFSNTSSISESLKNHFTDKCSFKDFGRRNSEFKLDLRSIDKNYKFPILLDSFVHSAFIYPDHSNNLTLKKHREMNIHSTLNLYESLIRNGTKHFVYISSFYVANKTQFDSHYIDIKREIENLLIKISKNRPLKLLIIRPSRIIGTHKKNKLNQPFFYKIIENVTQNKDVVIYGKNDALRNFIDNIDLSESIFKAIKKNISGNYYCINKNYFKISEIFYKTKLLSRSQSKLFFDYDKTDLLDDFFITEKSIFKKINSTQKISLEESIKHIIRSNYEK